jgi:flagellin-like protein
MKSLKPAEPTDRSVSPLIGVILMVAIVLLLAAVIASMVFDFEDRLQEPVPVGDFEQEYVPSGEDNTNDRPYITIRNTVGQTIDANNVLILDDSGNSVTWDEVWTGGPEVKANEFVHIDGFESDGELDPICKAGDSYRIILKRDDGSTAIINEWTAPKPPDLPAGSPSDADGDGIPDWC